MSIHHVIPYHVPVIKLRYWFPLVGWTVIGRKIQPPSRGCPIPVQGLSKGQPGSSSVQSLSEACQVPVQADTHGQRLDMKTQYLSKQCPIRGCQIHIFQHWTDSGQILDLDNLWTEIRLFVSQRGDVKGLDNL